MGFFNKFNKKAESQPTGEQNNNSRWDNLGQEVPFQGVKKIRRTESSRSRANQANPVDQDDPRQQRKIMYSLLYGPQGVAASDVSLTEQQTEAALDILSTEGWQETVERDLLTHIADPIRTPGNTTTTMFAKSFAGHNYENSILAHMVGAGTHNYNQMEPRALNYFLQTFPLPMDFEKTSADFLDSVKQTTPPQEYARYQQAMHNLKHSIYGKRQEYWEQMKILNDKAELHHMAKHATMDADPVRINGQDYPLTPEALKQAGLAPEHLVKIGDRKIGLSGVFNVSGRDCAIGYVKDDKGQVKVRGYYQSGSQGVWRYVPECICKPEGGISYYGKGGFSDSEEKITLPWQLQQKLGSLAGSVAERKDQETAAFGAQWWLLAGTARQYHSKDELIQAHNANTVQNDLYRETPNTPEIRMGSVQDCRRPEMLDVTGPAAPDFQSEIASFDIPSREYGKIRMRVYNSADRKLQYIYSDTPEGVWLSSIQTNGAVGSTGCKKNWVAGGDMVTPIHEYATQSAGYGEPVPGRRYVSMWRNYLSRAPIIQKYVRQGIQRSA